MALGVRKDMDMPRSRSRSPRVSETRGRDKPPEITPDDALENSGNETPSGYILAIPVRATTNSSSCDLLFSLMILLSF